MDKSKPLTLSWEFGVAARCVSAIKQTRHTNTLYYHGGFRAVARGRLRRALCLISSSD